MWLGAEVDDGDNNSVDWKMWKDDYNGRKEENKEGLMDMKEGKEGRDGKGRSEGR